MMKLNAFFILIWLLFAGVVVSCQEEDLDSNSIFDDELLTEKNELDYWIERNYLYAYNVDFKYRMEDIESSLSHNLVPIDYDLAVQMARIVKHVWFEAYDEVAGIDFMCKYAPRVIHLVGSRQWNPNGTITNGYAEGGLKVTLVGGNWLDPTSAESLNSMYFKTMHHEFAHILHQTKNYPVEYQALSEGHYSPSGWNNRNKMSDYAPFGFVTAYGSSQPGEDIAEVTACYITWTQAQWDELKAGAGTDGWNIILQKIEMVQNYMKENYSIDMDVLRDVINRRCEELQLMDLSKLPN